VYRLIWNFSFSLKDEEEEGKENAEEIVYTYDVMYSLDYS
jgi:hypothetical protein